MPSIPPNAKPMPPFVMPTDDEQEDMARYASTSTDRAANPYAGQERYGSEKCTREEWALLNQWNRNRQRIIDRERNRREQEYMRRNGIRRSAAGEGFFPQSIYDGIKPPPPPEKVLRILDKIRRRERRETRRGGQ